MKLAFTPPSTAARAPAPTDRRAAEPPTADYFALKSSLHQRLLERLDLAGLGQRAAEQVRAEVAELVLAMLKEDARPLNGEELLRLLDDLMDDLTGFGPLEPLLQDQDISDILVNTAREVYVERGGRIERTQVRFADERHLLRVIERIVDKVGRRIDESQPMVDARLPDGSRINAVIPPIAVDGAQLSIRRFARIPFDLDRLVATGALDARAASLLQGMVAARLNILISGGTGTGKTTLLNAMSTAIGAQERVVTIEDAAELQLQQPHVVRLETRPANIEGRGEITQRDLLRNALRMRPDRIIVGEVRAGEAFDMLQAMNTGHHGSITTVHANTPRDALSRLEQMVGMAGLDLAPRAMRSQIASAIEVVIQLQRFADGARRVVSIQEIAGQEGEVITMQELLRFDAEGVDELGRTRGRFVWTGLRPLCLEKARAAGVRLQEGPGA
ncbi:CpaF family protein [Phenylobacterium sp.]|uniref:CpaF family protein n=1 Tax=Phenylobacterium sp. TaxID=1871053 RepID=UPI002CA0D70B|nr:CpaF family protein [Phenylobacterium sp.]HVI31061.1 CpaF family protein [Phenylobacterium sp.]